MDNQTSDLATAFRRLSESLQQLAENLRDLSTRMGDPVYRRFDMPFGPSEDARRIWIRYGQFTTRN